MHVLSFFKLLKKVCYNFCKLLYSDFREMDEGTGIIDNQVIYSPEKIMLSLLASDDRCQG